MKYSNILLYKFAKDSSYFLPEDPPGKNNISLDAASAFCTSKPSRKKILGSDDYMGMTAE